MNSFDLAIIGSGPGGYRAAVLAALRGLKVAIVEKYQWGGCCLNRGCVPKKAWYHSARLIAASRDFAARGIHGPLQGDLTGAWRHQREVVLKVRASYTDYLARLGVATVQGAARFVDRHTLALSDGARIAAGHVIVATGSAPFVPPGLQRVPGRVLTTDDLFEREPPPGRRVALIGSGVVSTEFAFILGMLGCEVVWLMQQEPLARSRYSSPARKALRDALAACGIVPRTASRVVAAEADERGVTLTLPDASRERVDWVLLGAGRVPHTGGLDLAAAGVEVDAAGFIEVDVHQQTTAPPVYAIGDVANRAMTSNHALAEAAVAVSNIIAGRSRRRDESAVPEAVYSALELARIGLNEDLAEAGGMEPAVGFAAFEANPAALGEGDARGFVRLIADTGSGRLLGAEIVGSNAAELIHVLGVEFGNERVLEKLAGAAYNHPTRAEEILNAVETLAARWKLGGYVFGAAADQ
ncbi:MAG: dihydrolipoyl dehydrogenase family protein [Burkholderiales bacterium]